MFGCEDSKFKLFRSLPEPLMPEPLIRSVRPEEAEALLQLGISTGIFNDGEAEELLGETLRQLFAGALPSGHQAYTYVLLFEGSSEPLGWCYFGPEESESLCYNLYWIGISPSRQGEGFGKQLLKFIEAKLSVEHGATKLVIETSSGEKFVNTREFYLRQGYHLSRRESDAYGPGEDKLVFLKVF